MLFCGVPQISGHKENPGNISISWVCIFFVVSL